jgi:hypothetical protein
MKSTFNQSKLVAIALVSFTLATQSCRKEDVDNDTAVARTENQVESYFSDMNDVSDQVARRGDLSGFKIADDASSPLSSCATITIDTIINGGQLDSIAYTIDFGSGCTGNDGKVRAGKIIATANGPYFQEGTIINITPVNYSVNGNILSGFRRLTNTTSSGGLPTFTVEVNGTVTLADNAGTITWTANRVRTWLEGFNTPLVFIDDVISTTGNSNGTRASGATWTSLINTPLVYKRSCRQIVSGTMTLTPSDKPVRNIDFGSGNCDNTATVTINGNTFTIITN